MTSAQLEAKYGQPNAAYFSKYCAIWQVHAKYPWFPAKQIYINSDFQAMMDLSLASVFAAGVSSEILTFDGCFNERDVRGSSTALSAHYYAAAMDLNAHLNGMVLNPTPVQRTGKWSAAFIKAMCSSGIFFGGNFIHRADPMHWSLADM